MTKRSGRNLTDAERARNGWGRITLRLPADTITLMGILADECSMSRAEYVHELVERADREHARREHEQIAPLLAAAARALPEPQGAPSGWLAAGLAQAVKDSTPEQRQRVIDNPSGFRPEPQGAPDELAGLIANTCSPDEQKRRIAHAKLELAEMQGAPPFAPCAHTLNTLGHCTRCGGRPNDR